MAGDEEASGEQMTVRDLKLETKDDEGGESKEQRKKRLLAKDQNSGTNAKREKDALVHETELNFKKETRRNS